MEETKKVCNKCGVEKDLEEFFKSPKGKLGRKSICKSCTSSALKLKRDAIPKISGKPRKDLDLRRDAILLKCVDKYNKKFDYSRVNFTNTEIPVEIVCTRHGVSFWQRLSNHSRRCVGCRQCVLEHIAKVRTRTTEDVVEEFVSLFGDMFDYSKVDYKGTNEKIEIICNKCRKAFWQRHSSHLCGTGCPHCTSNGYNADKQGLLYILSDGEITKIGITNRCVEVRLTEINKDSGKNFKVVYTESSEDGLIPFCAEYALKIYLKHTHKSVSERFDGYTECFFGVDKEHLIKMVKQHFKNLQGIA